MSSRGRSAGVLPVRRVEGRLEFFLVHPGGPFFAKKDAGVWSVPKGLIDERDTDELEAAKRELVEETGLPAPAGPYVDLGTVRQKGGKVVRAFAVAAELDPAALASNRFEMEWPPRSGARASFPEVDRAEWMDRETAAARIVPAQAEFLMRAEAAAGAIFAAPDGDERE
ncbi:MAG: NUDIX domain-containing protein [Sandaracinaceae bacterium]|nr:NUDIX domain-containing protein [Sandaracinaceae bacterium]